MLDLDDFLSVQTMGLSKLELEPVKLTPGLHTDKSNTKYI